MKKTTYNKLQKSAIAYFNSLDLNDVKKETLKGDFLLNQNAKLKKSKSGDSFNYGLELVPSDFIGQNFNFCGAETSCKFTCLMFSGVQNILKTKALNKGELTPVIKKRIRRAFLFLKEPEYFYKYLRHEVTQKNELAKLQGQRAKFRLNVLSDLDWRPLQDSMPEIIFYDYSKYWQRAVPSNVTIAYSASERTTPAQIKAKLKSGHIVAMVFKTLPESWNGFKVVDGDLNDNIYDQEPGTIIGLKIKNTVNQKEKKNNFLNNYQEK